MRKLRLVAVVLACAAAIDCHEPGAPQLASLAGTWRLQSLQFASIADPSPLVPTQLIDLVSDLGASGTVTITADGGYARTLTLRDTTRVEEGSIVVDGIQVTITTADGAREGTVMRLGNRVTLALERGVSYDFDGDGTDEPATAAIIMEMGEVITPATR